MEANLQRHFTTDLAKYGEQGRVKVYFATENKKKYAELEFLGRGAFELLQHPLEIPEIQGTMPEIIASKLESARQQSTAFPIIVDDTGFEIDALKGFPGPYIKHFLDRFNCTGIVKLVDKIDPALRTARAVCSLGYLESAESEPIYAFGYCDGEIHDRTDGEYKGFGFDPIFFPFPDKAFSDLSVEEKGNVSHRAHALVLLMDKIRASQASSN
uniref:Non-canonical purine NTP pyrophosphatase n=1 Tax=Panagrellus redivivus TaxID=6233 RepID=A0A7E4VK05_PANRE